MILTLLLTACVRDVATEGVAPSRATTDAPPRIRIAGLVDVACDRADCRALADGTLLRLPEATPIGTPGALAGADTLRFGADGWAVEVPCEAGRCVRNLDADGVPGDPTPADAPAVEVGDPLPLAEAGDAFTEAWNRGVAAGWRSGFVPLVIGPGDGRITWLRGLDGAGQLVRTGGGSRTVRLGSASGEVSYPAWLAMHPTGTEAYLVAWPSPVVRAFDPSTLDMRWTLPVDGAAHGLFVDPGGRWLVVGVGPATTERFADWPVLHPDPASPVDPFRDEALRALDRPPTDEILVVDLATREVVARAEGAYRRFLPLQRPVLATDREIVFLDPHSPTGGAPR